MVVHVVIVGQRVLLGPPLHWIAHPTLHVLDIAARYGRDIFHILVYQPSRMDRCRVLFQVPHPDMRVRQTTLGPSSATDKEERGYYCSTGQYWSGCI